MKTIFNSIFASLIALTLLVLSCDKIDNPVPQKFGTLNWDLFPGGDSASYPWPTWTTNTNTFQNVLLEDYTGHTCTNCPAAAIVAKSIEDANLGRVFVASVHASTTGGFQAPNPPEFLKDFRTPEGNEYAQAMQIVFNPAGTINRTQNGGNYFQFFSDWNNSVQVELAKIPKVNLQLKHNYYPTTRGLFFHTETDMLTNLSGDYNLIVFLIKKVVVAPQEGQGITYEEYDHHNVFVGCLNGTWGTNIVAGSASTGDKIYNNFSVQLPNNATDTTFNIDNLRLMTFVCDRNSLEVLQVIQTDLE
jgi:hypothetical protein